MKAFNEHSHGAAVSQSCRRPLLARPGQEMVTGRGALASGPGTAHQHAGAVSYGNPFTEHDTIALAGGTGQFAVLAGTANFHTFGAGARFTGTLEGTLSS